MSVYTEIDARIREFIESQHMFFVGTAPSGPGGHVNISPKGIDSLRVLGPKTVAYADYTGSGIETVAHLRENGRIAIMLCAFTGPPRIVRLHGRGEAIEPQDDSSNPRNFGSSKPGNTFERSELSRCRTTNSPRTLRKSVVRFKSRCS
jgi:Pyridoxamine 5'-phosphate oxidase